MKKPTLPPYHRASLLLRAVADRLAATAWAPTTASQLYLCLAVERPRPLVMAWVLAGLRYTVLGSPRPAPASWLDGWLGSAGPADVASALRAAAEALDFPASSPWAPTSPEEAACLLLDLLPHRFTGQRPYTQEEWEWLLLEAATPPPVLRALGREVVRLPPREGPIRAFSAWVMEWAVRQVVALAGPLFLKTRCL